jgi:hypothetical protein
LNNKETETEKSDIFLEMASTVAAPAHDALPTGVNRVADAAGAK